MPQVAVLVDGENMSVEHVDAILMRSKKLGALRVRCVFGNACLLPDWRDQPGFRMVHTGTGKNSADIKMAIDAMELACTQEIEQFVIVTSDSDFSHLAHALRERGARVLGIGDHRAADRFRQACTDFLELPPVTSAKSVTKNTSLDEELLCALRVEGGRNGIEITQINSVMRRRCNVQISTYPEKNWREYLLKRPHLFRCDPKGPNARVYQAAHVSACRSSR